MSLARSGAYLGGGPAGVAAERSRWRFTFKRLPRKPRTPCRPGTPSPRHPHALEQLIDRLAREADRYDYFRSDDPVAAAGFVVSDIGGAGHYTSVSFAAEIGAAIPP